MAQKTEEKDKNPVHIFLDIDGVLADFDLHLHNGNKLTADGKTKWSELDYDWYVTMPVFDGAREFYDETRQMGTVKFLTAPILNEDCFSGKARWVQVFAPQRGKMVLQDLIICPSADKAYLARPNHILVDDREKNIAEWVAAGGIGIHHTGDFSETLRQVKEAVSGLKAVLPVQKPAASKPPKAGPV